MSFEELVAFYDAWLPEGQSFRDWNWCRSGGDAENPTRIYSRGKKSMLTVLLTDDEPPGISIYTDESQLFWPIWMPVKRASGPCG